MTRTIEFKYDIGDEIYTHDRGDDIITKGTICSCILGEYGIKYDVKFSYGVCPVSESLIFLDKKECLQEAKDFILSIHKNLKEIEIDNIERIAKSKIKSLEISCQ